MCVYVCVCVSVCDDDDDDENEEFKCCAQISILYNKAMTSRHTGIGTSK